MCTCVHGKWARGSLECVGLNVGTGPSSCALVVRRTHTCVPCCLWSALGCCVCPCACAVSQLRGRHVSGSAPPSTGPGGPFTGLVRRQLSVLRVCVCGEECVFPTDSDVVEVPGPQAGHVVRLPWLGCRGLSSGQPWLSPVLEAECLPGLTCVLTGSLVCLPPPLWFPQLRVVTCVPAWLWPLGLSRPPCSVAGGVHPPGSRVGLAVAAADLNTSCLGLAFCWSLFCRPPRPWLCIPRSLHWLLGTGDRGKAPCRPSRACWRLFSPGLGWRLWRREAGLLRTGPA